MAKENPVISPARFDAVLFDMDGVLTATAVVHSAAWKRMFDEFLRAYAERSGTPFKAFEIDTDYIQYVDGKPRFAGVRSFLASRQIELAEGGPEDDPGRETVHGLGNRKNDLVNAVIASEGVVAYPGSVALVRELRSQGIKTAVVSSSANAETVLQAAGIADLFDVRIDGAVAGALKLAGKPAPDTYRNAAEQLGVEPSRAVVVEDAISGVQAGRAGAFGLVIGVARKGDSRVLLENGADMVVADLGELLP